ncbi:MAG: symporter small accessory protein [Chitinispirillaceae bacterium]
MILGLEGTGVVLAYVCCIGATLLCVVYGIRNWNLPRENEQKQIEEEIAWEQHDPELAEAETLGGER